MLVLKRAAEVAVEQTSPRQFVMLFDTIYSSSNGNTLSQAPYAVVYKCLIFFSTPAKFVFHAGLSLAGEVSIQLEV